MHLNVDKDVNNEGVVNKKNQIVKCIDEKDLNFTPVQFSCATVLTIHYFSLEV